MTFAYFASFIWVHVTSELVVFLWNTPPQHDLSFFIIAPPPHPLLHPRLFLSLSLAGHMTPFKIQELLPRGRLPQILDLQAELEMSYPYS